MVRINHNLNSMNNNRLRNNAVNKGRKSAEKLSSGLRINRAGDDAAGLSISEKMRAQIRGMKQASRNIQDGISLIQTAEGGLNEIHSLLQRGRKLSVQAANDTLTNEDKQAIQKEVDQINSEINRMANDTEFNGIKLVNQTGISSYEANGINSINGQNVIDGLKKGWLEVSENLIFSKYGLKGDGGNLNVILDKEISGGMAYVLCIPNNHQLHISMSDFQPGNSPDGINKWGKGFYDDRVIAHEMVHAVMDQDFGGTKFNEIYYGNGIWFIEGSAEFMHGADERLKIDIGSFGTIDNAKGDALVSRAEDLLNGAAWAGSSLDYSAGYTIMKYLDSKLGANTMANLMTDIDASGDTGMNALKTAIGTRTTSGSFSQFVTDFSQAGAGGGKDYVLNSITLNWGGDEIDTGSISGSDHGGASINAENVVDEATATDTADGQPLDNFNVIWPSVNDNSNVRSSSESLKIQVGANEGMEIEIPLIDVTTNSIGINNINVVALAQEAIDKFDNAINIVSDKHSILGAIQNRLEHAKAFNDINYENTSTSESRIRDTDMAKEMMNYVKENILSQAAQFILAQSNQAPQETLKLLG